jgi:CHAT domain-containing protein
MDPRIAIVGPPDYHDLPHLSQLAGAEKEVQNIRQLYSTHTGIIGEPLIGNQANEKNFWKLASHQDSVGGILHISCHGFFEINEPMNSGVLMSKSKIDAAEIARSSLRYESHIECLQHWLAPD